jgi:hypothetical protein
MNLGTLSASLYFATLSALYYRAFSLALGCSF